MTPTIILINPVFTCNQDQPNVTAVITKIKQSHYRPGVTQMIPGS